MLKMYAKTEVMLDLLQMFTTSQWKFHNNNTIELLSSLNTEDRKQFEFSLKKFDWEQYTKSYYYGLRKHILHEDLSNMVKAKSRSRKYVYLIIIIFTYLYIRILVGIVVHYYQMIYI